MAGCGAGSTMEGEEDELESAGDDAAEDSSVEGDMAAVSGLGKDGPRR